MSCPAPFRCGYAAIVGRPNVGKSTLLNAMLGEKLSIVAPRPQTTRHRILGIRTDERGQILFVDTPGLHPGRGRVINRLMNRTAAAALADADVALFVIEALRWTAEDAAVLERLSPGKTLLVINKVDRVVPKAQLLPFLEETAARGRFAEVVPVSALTGANVELLPELILDRLPAGPALYAADQITDKSMRFLAGEIIREKLTWRLRDELPYGIAVEVERYEEAAGGVLVAAVIWVERESQKPIVIGRGGELLKTVGRAARLELKARIGRPVHVELRVKVKENWADSERALRELGYDPSR
ncbi:MAG TPA: GTPase Era [Gammaproteobacteria bacterium]|nr:GTPase Era [Gammaproteobacteria bacterium]